MQQHFQHQPSVSLAPPLPPPPPPPLLPPQAMNICSRFDRQQPLPSPSSLPPPSPSFYTNEYMLNDGNVIRLGNVVNGEGGMSSLRVRFRMITRKSTQHHFRARISSKSSSISSISSRITSSPSSACSLAANQATATSATTMNMNALPEQQIMLPVQYISYTSPRSSYNSINRTREINRKPEFSSMTSYENSNNLLRQMDTTTLATVGTPDACSSDYLYDNLCSESMGSSTMPAATSGNIHSNATTNVSSSSSTSTSSSPRFYNQIPINMSIVSKLPPQPPSQSTGSCTNINNNRTATIKTFKLTDDLKSNIRLDITLKPMFSIRDDRLDATKQTHLAAPDTSNAYKSIGLTPTRSASCELGLRQAYSERNINIEMNQNKQDEIHLPINIKRSNSSSSSGDGGGVISVSERNPTYINDHSSKSDNQIIISLNSPNQTKDESIKTTTATNKNISDLTQQKVISPFTFIETYSARRYETLPPQTLTKEARVFFSFKFYT
jgi:hypothetical protein